MAAGNRPLAAVHYFYLLKDDQEELMKLWSSLTGEAPGGLERPAFRGLAGPELSPAEYCQIVHRVSGDDFDLCLAMLADLLFIQTLYHDPGAGTLGERWTGALERIHGVRAKLEEGFDIFGETILLVSAGEADDSFFQTASGLAGDGKLLKSALDPAAGGDKYAVLVNLPGAVVLPAVSDLSDSGGFFAVAAREPGNITSILFPQFDSAIKKLARFSAYFREQRNTIITERNGVDREIGALLHHQVIVPSTAEQTEAAGLERQIESLAKMFGVLATDSLLVRQAGDRLEKDIGLLQRFRELMVAGPPQADEIGEYYLEMFDAELRAAREENHNLEFSRQNALAAMEVVRTQVELLRAGEEAGIQEQTRELLSRSLVLQKERLSLQVAAGFVEFVLVFYYVLGSWEGILGMEAVEHISPLARFVIVGSIAASAALGTHFLSQVLQSRSLKNPGFLISALVLVLSFAAMVILSVNTLNS